MIAAVICDVVARSVAAIALCNCFSLSVNCVTDSIRRAVRKFQLKHEQNNGPTQHTVLNSEREKERRKLSAHLCNVSHTRLRIRMDLIGEIWKHDARTAKSTARTTNPPRTHTHTHVLFLPIAVFSSLFVVCFYQSTEIYKFYIQFFFLSVFAFVAVPTMVIKLQHSTTEHTNTEWNVKWIPDE